MKCFYQVFIPLVLLSDFVHTFSFLSSSPPYSSSLFQFLLILYHVCICTAYARGCAHTQMERGKRQTRCSIKSCMQSTIFTIKAPQIYQVRGCVLDYEQVFAHTHTHVCKYICSYHFHIHVTWFLDLLYSAHSKKSNIRPLLCSMNEVRHTNTIHMT